MHTVTQEMRPIIVQRLSSLAVALATAMATLSERMGRFDPNSLCIKGGQEPNRVSGSFGNSCSDVSLSGATLNAVCSEPGGTTKGTSINTGNGL